MEQDWRCTGWFNGWPTWIGGTGDEWKHCCVEHDRAYEANEVTTQVHIELGYCVYEAVGWLGIFVAVVMVVATIVYWLMRHKNQAGRRQR